MRIVAEGVESASDLEQLRQLGCDQAQGFFICPPRPADAVRLLTWLCCRDVQCRRTPEVVSLTLLTSKFVVSEIFNPIQRQQPAGITHVTQVIERVCQRYWRGISALSLPEKSTRARLRRSPPAALN